MDRDREIALISIAETISGMYLRRGEDLRKTRVKKKGEKGPALPLRRDPRLAHLVPQMRVQRRRRLEHARVGRRLRLPLVLGAAPELVDRVYGDGVRADLRPVVRFAGLPEPRVGEDGEGLGDEGVVGGEICVGHVYAFSVPAPWRREVYSRACTAAERGRRAAAASNAVRATTTTPSASSAAAGRW